MDIQERVARILSQREASEPAEPLADAAPQPLENLVPGYWRTHKDQRIYVGEVRYPLYHHHGARALDHYRQASRVDWPAVLFHRLKTFDLAGALFLDTETTGLGRGPGTFCFMVGIGRLEDDYLLVRQYMAPDYGHEGLMLREIEAEAARSTGLLTFNGRTFDLPILETRYILNGYERSPLAGLPHLDLLHTARRLWGRARQSCALGALEADLLEVERGDEDIPGYEIPEIYTRYLRTGYTDDIARVFYHNRIDVLSMVTLAAIAGDALAPDAPSDEARGAEALALGRIREADQANDRAMAAYRAALRSADMSARNDALVRLGTMLKRSGRLAEAVCLWTDALDGNTLYPYVELAKYYEHTMRDYPQATLLVRRAMQGLALGEIAHRDPDSELTQLSTRLARLQRRQSRASQKVASGEGTMSRGHVGSQH